MGRESKSLIEPAALAEINGGGEVMFAHAMLRCTSSADGTDFSDEGFLTLLLSFAPSPEQRRATRAHAANIAAASIIFEQFPAIESIGKWLESLMVCRPPSSTCVALMLPSYSQEVASGISSFITSLRTSSTHRLDLVVAVAESPADWAEIQPYVSGFVGAGNLGREVTANKVFTVLSALMSPGQATAFDPEDLRLALGSPSHPSSLLEAVWIPQDDVLMLGSESDRAMLRACEAVAVLPCQFMTLKSFHRLIMNVRSCCTEEAHVIPMLPYGHTHDLIYSKTVMPLTFLVSSLANEQSPLCPPRGSADSL